MELVLRAGVRYKKELLQLRWENVDLDLRVVRIVESKTEAGVNVEVMQEVMGHSDPTMLKRYSLPRLDFQKAEFNKLCAAQPQNEADAASEKPVVQ